MTSPVMVLIRCAIGQGVKADGSTEFVRAGGPRHALDFTRPRGYLALMEREPETSVLFNADCPVCNFEIRHYARHAATKGLPIRFDDLNSAAGQRWGLDADRAARRLHVLHEGQLTSGIPAFLVLWSQMPRYRWLARVVGLPGIRQVASAAYDLVLAPMLYRWHRRRQRRRTTIASE